MTARQSFVSITQLLPTQGIEQPLDSLYKDYPLPDWMFQDSPHDELWIHSTGSDLDNLTVAVRLLKVGSTYNGKPYARVMVQDRSDSLPGVLWASSEEEVSDFTEVIRTSGIMTIRGYVGEYPKDSGQRQCVIQSYKRSEVKAAAVLPTAWPMYDPYAELHSLVKSIEMIRQPFRDMANWSIEQNWPAFGLAPAALSYHHAFLGGLLVHTSQLLRLLSFVFRDPASAKREIQTVTWRFIKAVASQTFENSMGSTYLSSSLDHAFQMAESCAAVLSTSEIDTDICLLSALYHDLGKTREYEFTQNIDMHPRGKLLGHIFESTTMASQAMEVFEVPDVVRHQVLHPILAHHGLLEYGSPVKPQTPEAIVLHWADYICSRCS